MAQQAGSQPNVIVVGGGPLAMLTALMLTNAGKTVTIVGEASPTNPPLNPELMLIGGDDSLPPLFQSSLTAWRNLSETLSLPALLTNSPAQDLATSIGRVEKLREEAMLDALGGEPVTFIEGTPDHAPIALGYKNWEAAPILFPTTLALLHQAIAVAQIRRNYTNPASLTMTGPQPVMTLEDETRLEAPHIIFTSARALRRVLPPLGLSLPLRPARGHVLMLQTSRPHGLPLMLQRLHRGHLFIVPVSENRVDIHYDAINDPAQSTFNTQHSPGLVSALQQHVGQLAPALSGATLIGVAIARHWLTPDFLPALGTWPGLPGVLVGTGWGGRGTALAAGAATILTEIVKTGGTETNILPLSPNRFANGLWQVVKQPGSLSWQEPNLVEGANLMSPKPEYMQNVNLTEAPKAEYATKVQQISKTITESAARRPSIVQVQPRSSKPKITTAAIKGN